MACNSDATVIMSSWNTDSTADTIPESVSCHIDASCTAKLCNLMCLQMGNLVSLRPRGGTAQASSGSNPGGEWEQWPEAEGSANEDDELQRAIAASLADPTQGDIHQSACCAATACTDAGSLMPMSDIELLLWLDALSMST